MESTTNPAEPAELTSHREYRRIHSDRKACVDKETFEALGDPKLRELRDDKKLGESGTKPTTILTRGNQIFAVLEVSVPPKYQCRRYFLNIRKEWQVVVDHEEADGDEALRWIARGPE